MGNELPRQEVLYIHLTLLPYIPTAGEMKTKPTQHSVKELRSIGIQPDILMCRCDRDLPETDKQKIALFCNIRASAVIVARDVENIYAVPQAYHEQGLDREVLERFGIDHNLNKPDLSSWSNIVKTMNSPEGNVTIAIVGKYIGFKDAYKSLLEALVHGGIANKVNVNIEWIDAERFLGDETGSLQHIDGILVPGGFGERGAEGKIEAAHYARVNNIPYFGICFGMQMAVLEVARYMAGIKDAVSSEFNSGGTPVVGLMNEWLKGEQLEKRGITSDLGGTMRLGAFETLLKKDSKVAKIYETEKISERHRHRYEVNMSYRETLEKAGLIFSGLSPDGLLPEVVELLSHPWYIGVQFHPELKSRPFEPHPLFSSFIEASLVHNRLV